ncbi:Tar ligand binding domain-containing protein, partial [Nostoc sp. NIES-2111]
MLQRMTIRTRLIVSFSVLVALLLVLGGNAWWGGFSHQRAFERFSRDTVDSLVLADEVWAGVLSSRRHEKDMVLLSGYGQHGLEHRRLWNEQQARLKKSLRQLDTCSGGGDEV